MLYYNNKLYIDLDQDRICVGDFQRILWRSSENVTNPGDALTEGTLAIEVARGNLTETTAYMSPVAQRVSDKAMMSFKA